MHAMKQGSSVLVNMYSEIEKLKSCRKNGTIHGSTSKRLDSERIMKMTSTNKKDPMTTVSPDTALRQN